MAAGRSSAILCGEVIASEAAVVALAVFRLVAAPKGFADQSSGHTARDTGSEHEARLTPPSPEPPPACTIHSAAVGTVK